MKKRNALIAVGVLASFILTGCSASNSDSKTTISLGSTPTVSALSWKVDATALPEGYKVDTASEGLTTNVIIKNASSSCEIMFAIEYAASYEAGKGDLFLSKEAVYNQVSRDSGTSTPDVVANIPVDAKTNVEFVSQQSTAPAASSFSVQGTAKATIINSVYSARTFDTLQDNGFDPDAIVAKLKESGSAYDPNMYSKVGLNGSDATKGLPIAKIYYQCNDETIDPANWKQLVAATTLIGVTAK